MQPQKNVNSQQTHDQPQVLTSGLSHGSQLVLRPQVEKEAMRWIANYIDGYFYVSDPESVQKLRMLQIEIENEKIKLAKLDVEQSFESRSWLSQEDGRLAQNGSPDNWSRSECHTEFNEQRNLQQVQTAKKELEIVEQNYRENIKQLQLKRLELKRNIKNRENAAAGTTRQGVGKVVHIGKQEQAKAQQLKDPSRRDKLQSVLDDKISLSNEQSAKEQRIDIDQSSRKSQVGSQQIRSLRAQPAAFTKQSVKAIARKQSKNQSQIQQSLQKAQRAHSISLKHYQKREFKQKGKSNKAGQLNKSISVKEGQSLHSSTIYKQSSKKIQQNVKPHCSNSIPIASMETEEAKQPEPVQTNQPANQKVRIKYTHKIDKSIQLSQSSQMQLYKQKNSCAAQSVEQGEAAQLNLNMKVKMPKSTNIINEGQSYLHQKKHKQFIIHRQSSTKNRAEQSDGQYVSKLSKGDSQIKSFRQSQSQVFKEQMSKLYDEIMTLQEKLNKIQQRQLLIDKSEKYQSKVQSLHLRQESSRVINQEQESPKTQQPLPQMKRYIIGGESSVSIVLPTVPIKVDKPSKTHPRLSLQRSIYQVNTNEDRLRRMEEESKAKQKVALHQEISRLKKIIRYLQMEKIQMIDRDSESQLPNVSRIHKLKQSSVVFEKQNKTMSFQKKEEAFEGEEIQEPIPSQRKRWNAMALRHRFSDLGKIIKNLPDKNPKDIQQQNKSQIRTERSKRNPSEVDQEQLDKSLEQNHLEEDQLKDPTKNVDSLEIVAETQKKSQLKSEKAVEFKAQKHFTALEAVEIHSVIFAQSPVKEIEGKIGEESTDQSPKQLLNDSGNKQEQLPSESPSKQPPKQSPQQSEHKSLLSFKKIVKGTSEPEHSCDSAQESILPAMTSACKLDKLKKQLRHNASIAKIAKNEEDFHSFVEAKHNLPDKTSKQLSSSKGMNNTQVNSTFLEHKINYQRLAQQIKRANPEEECEPIPQIKLKQIPLPKLPEPPSFSGTQEELLQLARQTYQQFGVVINDQSDQICVKKYKNCVMFTLSSKPSECVLWHYSGKFYMGGWKNSEAGEGEKNGEGFEEIPGKHCYMGQFLNSKKHGTGVLVMSNGNIYDGQWVDGIKNGRGTFFDAVTKTMYQGDWQDGKKDGFGLLKLSEKEYYQGTFFKSVKDGYGTELFANGGRYRGEYKNGKFHGKGKYTWGNGSYYEGSFREGVRHGQGSWRSAADNADIYIGGYENDKKNGYGRYIWSNGCVYEGGFSKDLKHGKGRLTYQDGKEIKGVWQQGSLLMAEMEKKTLENEDHPLPRSSHISIKLQAKRAI